MTRSYLIKRLGNIDYVMGVSAFLLIFIGTVMIFSSSSLLATEKYGSSSYFLMKHLAILTLSVSIGFGIFFLNIRFIEKMSIPLLLFVMLLLFMTLFSPLGVEANHAQRWLNMGFMRLQVSEIAKPLVLLYAASYFSRKEKKLGSFVDGILPLLVIVGIVVLLILKQPDFGSAFVLLMCVGMMLFAAGARFAHMFALTSLFTLGSVLLIQSAEYRMKRMLTFLNPWEDPQGAGFQILQSLVAFERGGLHGKGLGDGVQKLLYLPEAHTDFIFSVIAEEFGLLGTGLTVFLFICFIVQGLKLAASLEDRFASLLATGFTCLIGFQAMLNMAVASAMVPTKGLTLPFISYGGSSLLCSIICLSILLSLSASVGMAGRQAKRGLS